MKYKVIRLNSWGHMAVTNIPAPTKRVLHEANTKGEAIRWMENEKRLRQRKRINRAYLIGGSILLLMAVSELMGCAANPYVEFMHISSVKDGPPPSYREYRDETEVNTIGLGLRKRYRNGMYVDGQLAAQTGPANRSELEGSEPHFILKIGKEWGAR